MLLPLSATTAHSLAHQNERIEERVLNSHMNRIRTCAIERLNWGTMSTSGIILGRLTEIVVTGQSTAACTAST